MKEIQSTRNTPKDIQKALSNATKGQTRCLENIMANMNKQITNLENVLLSQADIFNRKEAAEYLNISLYTLGDLTRKGKLKSYPIRGKYFYKKRELDLI